MSTLHECSSINERDKSSVVETHRSAASRKAADELVQGAGWRVALFSGSDNASRVAASEGVPTGQIAFQ